MSNGNLDNSAPLVGVLKLQMTWPKQRGLELKRVYQEESLLQFPDLPLIRESSSRRRVRCTQPGPWGLHGLTQKYMLWSELSGCLHIPGQMTRAMIKDTRRKEERSRQGKEPSQKAWWQSCTNERVHVTRSDIPRVSFPRSGLKWWNYSLGGWREDKLGASYFSSVSDIS